MASLFKKVFIKQSRKHPAYASLVRENIDNLPELSAKLEFLLHDRQFRVDQKKPEFLALLNKIKNVQANEILEIGGRRGGSSILFSYAAGDQARILTVDLNNNGYRLKSLNKFSENRKIQFWQGDSHLQETYDKVEKYLEGNQFDVLFIDGDHTYEGAKQDFVKYSHLVKDGGIIALHDIQEDYKTRFDVQTASWTGGVPLFWREVKAAGFNTEDLISDPFQDGYGIGVVNWNSKDSKQLLEKLN